MFHSATVLQKSKGSRAIQLRLEGEKKEKTKDSQPSLVCAGHDEITVQPASSEDSTRPICDQISPIANFRPAMSPKRQVHQFTI